MIVSTQTYLIILVAIAFLITLKPLYTRYVKKEGNKHDWMFILLLLILPLNWFTPTLITITDCNKFTKEVLLFPTKRNNISFTYGWNNYIINESNQSLAFEYIYYGDNQRKDDQFDQIILPKLMGKVNVVKIDYLFEDPDKSVSTKSSGATKTILYCTSKTD